MNLKKVLFLLLTLLILLSFCACSPKNVIRNSSATDSTVSTSTSLPSASGNNSSKPSKDIRSTEMNLTQIQGGNYSSIQGTWIEVAYAVNKLDGNGYQWHSGASLSNDTLSVSSDKITFNGIKKMVIQGNTITDSEGTHLLSYENSEDSLDASLADVDSAFVNWDVSFYPKGVKNDIETNNGVKISNTKNLIEIWMTGVHYAVVFAQTDTNS